MRGDEFHDLELRVSRVGGSWERILARPFITGGRGRWRSSPRAATHILPKPYTAPLLLRMLAEIVTRQR